MESFDMAEAPGVAAARALGIDVRIIHPGHVTSVAEAAHACGVGVDDVVKTLVIRRADDDFLLALIPGSRSLSWKKVRTLVGVNRISLPDAETAKQVTGYERGTITPLGLALPVLADERIVGRTITLGTGQRGTVVAVDADAVINAYRATIADVSDAE
jgi:Cys-tRNA(Pro)/Cys-tRNA(Cys) deacylase